MISYHFSDSVLDDMLLSCIVAIAPEYLWRAASKQVEGIYTGDKYDVVGWCGLYINSKPLFELRVC